ncbi:hypothetical protein [Acidovorax sp. PRC11]|uniref:hypothetical protein n=1 Tax=Acidovorax sp. PRC11 TaxID=2962592 RepID=UPI002880CE8E|nr:hypothetical protein [Acidovorax sp. PRC11]MDT0139727.1 hypothetical protein [Acidovorax sp. PRC11]
MEDIGGMALHAPEHGARAGPATAAVPFTEHGPWGMAAGAARRVAEPGKRSGGGTPQRGTFAPPRADDPVEIAVAQLRLAWCTADPFTTADRWITSAEWHFRILAQALDDRRRLLAGRLAALGSARLQARAQDLAEVLSLARRLPRGLVPTRGAGLGGSPEQGAPRLEDLATAVERAAELRGSGGQGLPAGALPAWSLCAGDGPADAAQGNATVVWLGTGEVPPEEGRAPFLVLGGVVDAAVLRSLRACAEGRMDEALRVARLHSASLQDAAEQVECAAAALDAIDLRVQEIAWLLGRLQARLGPVALHARRVLDVQQAGEEGTGSADRGGVGAGEGRAESLPADRQLLSLLATVGGALYRTATVPVLDEAGRLTRQSGETVAAIRRWLMTHPEGPAEPGPP